MGWSGWASEQSRSGLSQVSNLLAPTTQLSVLTQHSWQRLRPMHTPASCAGSRNRVTQSNYTCPNQARWHACRPARAVSLLAPGSPAWQQPQLPASQPAPMAWALNPPCPTHPATSLPGILSSGGRLYNYNRPPHTHTPPPHPVPRLSLAGLLALPQLLRLVHHGAGLNVVGQVVHVPDLAVRLRRLGHLLLERVVVCGMPVAAAAAAGMARGRYGGGSRAQRASFWCALCLCGGGGSGRRVAALVGRGAAGAAPCGSAAPRGAAARHARTHRAPGSTGPWGPAPGTWCRGGSAAGPAVGVG